MDWRDVPSLRSLRAFEAAARLGSLSGAAAELNVSHAAIAAHVRGLEDAFGTPLMHRSGQGMATTPEGAQLALGLSDGFGSIAAACRDLADRGRTRPVSVTTTPAFAENWLMPRMGAFWAEHPEVYVSITPTGAVTDLRRDGYDLAVRYGDGGAWPGAEAEPLMTGDFVIVGDARAAARLDGAGDAALAEERWLMDPNRAEAPYLADRLGLAPDDLRVHQVATNGMVLSGATAGLGLALVTRGLVGDALAARRLHVVGEMPLEGVGYHLLRRPAAAAPAVEAFARWLKRTVKAERRATAAPPARPRAARRAGR